MNKQIDKRKIKLKNRIAPYINSEIDTTFLAITFLLLAIGLVMMFSASYAYAYYYKGDSYHFIKKQFLFAIFGIIVMLIVSRIDYHFWRKFALISFPIVIIMLVLCYFVPSVNGAHRWIFIGGIGFQPSEIAKLSLVLIYAHLLTSHRKKLMKFKYGFLPFIIVIGIYACLVIKEPHLSAALLLGSMAVIMLLVGEWPKKWVLLGAILIIIAIGAVMLIPSLHDRAMVRINAWNDPEADPLGTGYQTLQSLYAIGSGGIMGAGIGNSRQKYLFLPEPQNDFVFSVICEELGFVGALLIIALFAVFIWRGFSIALKCNDRFGSILTFGFVAQVGVQAILNMAVVTNAIPATGISLPFFSYGGTALVILLGEMGIVLSVSRQAMRESIQKKEM